MLLHGFEDAIEWKQRVADFSVGADSPHRVRAEFSDGSQQEFDLVIACDGVYSQFRESLVHDPLRYLGVMMINGIVDADGSLLKPNRSYSIQGDARNRLFLKPFRPGQLMWQMTHSMEEGAAVDLAKQDSAQWLFKIAEILSDWKHPILDTVRGTKAENMVK